MNNITIDEEFLQVVADQILERELTKSELEDVNEATFEELGWFLQDRIRGVVDFDQMIERNKGAENSFPYYKVLHRNENAYQPEFKTAGVFKNEKDARQYVQHDIITEFDEWKVLRVDEKHEEREVYSVHC